MICLQLRRLRPAARLRLQLGIGVTISVELAGGLPALRAFLDGLRCFSLAGSPGGVESLVAHPATMTHASMDPGARARTGISDALLRLSVGIEDPRDLCEDIVAGLERAATPTSSPRAIAAAKARGAFGMAAD